MSMRLFAYGGTSYTLRVCFGFSRWSAETLLAGEEALRQRDGLPAAGGTVGAVIVDGAPALVCRRLMKDREDRPNPITILLDPGAEFWRRAGWNAARLARILCGDDSAPGCLPQLLSFPESITPESLGLALEHADFSPLACQAPEREAAAGFLDSWAAMLSLLTKAGIRAALPQQTRVPVGGAMAGWRNAAGLEALLDFLPPSLRFGLGWVSSGPAGTAGALGACVVMEASAEDWAQHAPAGHIAGRWPAGKFFPQLGTEPMHQWPEKPEAGSLLQWGSWLNRGADGDVSWLEQAGELQEEELPEALLMDIAVVAAAAFPPDREGAGEEAEDSGLRKAATLRVLRRLLADPDSRLEMSFAGEAAVDFLLREKRWPPPQWASGPFFDEAAERRLWQGLAWENRTAQGLQKILRAAAGRMPAESVGRLVRDLGKDRHPALQPPLQDAWRDFLLEDQAPWRHSVKSWFRTCSAWNVCGGGPGAAGDFLTFWPDVMKAAAFLSGELEKHSLPDQSKAARQAVTSILEVLEQGGPMARRAEPFLAALEFSPLRTRTPVILLAQVMTRMPKQWPGLRWLLDLWSGGKYRPCGPWLTPEERQRLRAEFHWLAKQGQMSKKPPNLSGICDQLAGGDWPEREATLAALPRRELPPWPPSQRQRWAEELRAVLPATAAAASAPGLPPRRPVPASGWGHMTEKPSPDLIRQLILSGAAPVKPSHMPDWISRSADKMRLWLRAEIPSSGPDDGRTAETGRLPPEARQRLWNDLLKLNDPAQKALLRGYIQEAWRRSDPDAFLRGVVALFDLSENACWFCIGALHERDGLTAATEIAVRHEEKFEAAAKSTAQMVFKGDYAALESLMKNYPGRRSVLAWLEANPGRAVRFCPKKMRPEDAREQLRKVSRLLPGSDRRLSLPDSPPDPP